MWCSMILNFIMKLLLIITCLSFCYCSAIKNESKNEERRIAGGGNYGGFIGLTTYGAGPFLVKGYENEEKVSPRHEGENKQDDYIEDLGYDFDGCTGQFKSNNRDGYGRQRYRDDNRFDQRSGNYSRYYDDETREKCDYVFGYTGPKANDDPENLMHPCALDDWQCVRNFFAVNSKCKPAYGPIPDPLHIDINTVFHPSANLTVALPNLIVRGLSSARIRDFYVNKESGNLVFAIDVFNLNETIPRAYLRYRRTARESIVLADFGTIMFRAVTFTAVIPNIPDMRLDLADIHATIQSPLPDFFSGPEAYTSTDPDVITGFTELSSQAPIVVRETLLFQSQLFTSIYIQKNICDFGLQIISI